MREKLIIYLHADDLSQPSWVTLNASNQVVSNKWRANADELTSLAFDKEVIVIVPGEDILLSHVTLPKMQRNKFLLALPYALEDQLVADVDSLHFAPAISKDTTNLPVAVVAHAKMLIWMALLQAWQVQPDKIIPVTLTLPREPETWKVFLTDVAIVRTGDNEGMVCDLVNLPMVLKLALAACETKPNLQIQQFNTTSNLQLDANLIAHQEETLLTNLAANVTHFSAINLLQHKYALKKTKLPHIKKLWHITIGLAAAWLLFLIATPVVSYVILDHKVAEIDDQIAVIYQRNFPLAKNVVAPKRRMQDKLQKLSAHDSKLLVWIGLIGKGLQEAKNVTIQRMDYQNDQITLQLIAANSDNFNAFNQYLQQQGLTVKQQNATLNGEKINASLVID